MALQRLLPVVWVFATAFKDPRNALSLKVLFTPTLHNFVVAFGNPYVLGERLMNSVVVTTVTLLIALPVSTAAAPFGRWGYWRRSSCRRSSRTTGSKR